MNKIYENDHWPKKLTVKENPSGGKKITCVWQKKKSVLLLLEILITVNVSWHKIHEYLQDFVKRESSDTEK